MAAGGFQEPVASGMAVLGHPTTVKSVWSLAVAFRHWIACQDQVLGPGLCHYPYEHVFSLSTYWQLHLANFQREK